MKKLVCFILVLFSFLFISKASFADTGPKPSFEIQIKNINNSNYLVSYIIDNSSNLTAYGPHLIYDEENTENKYYYKESLSLLSKKVSLEENEAFLDIVSKYEVDNNLLKIKSYYMYPRIFKLVIYDEANDLVYVSEYVNCKTFNAYFKCDFKNITVNDTFTVKDSYQYGLEFLKFMIRLLICIAVEVGLAFLFKYDKKALIYITIVNIITQIGLNLFLNYWTVFEGKSWWYLFNYILIELIVLISEAVAYLIGLKRCKHKIGYVILANLLSFLIGTILWIFW